MSVKKRACALSDCPVFEGAALAPAQGQGLRAIDARGRLDSTRTSFWHSRPSSTDDRYQPMMAACANRGEVLSAGHAALYHGGLGFVSMRCSVTPSISSIVVMSGRLPAKTSDPWESLPRRAPDRKALVCNQGANRASSHAASWGRPGTSPRSRRGQIVKQNVFFKRKETLFPPTERRFKRPACPA